MSFGRWILIHSFSIFLVAMLVLGYLYREDLQLEQAYQQLLNLDQPAEQVINSLKLDKQPQQKLEKDTSTLKSEEIQRVEKSSDQQTTSKAVTEADRITATVNQQDAQLENILFDARQAFWERDYKTAIGHYQQLIASNPANPDYTGELGNIYYAMNDYKNAAELYFRTAQLLNRQGQRDAAMQLLAPLNAMNRELGDRLKQSLGQ